jgi:hypothetical protein
MIAPSAGRTGLIVQDDRVAQVSILIPGTAAIQRADVSDPRVAPGLSPTRQLLRSKQQQLAGYRLPPVTAMLTLVGSGPVGKHRPPPVLVSQNECDNPTRMLTVGVPCPICQGSEASSAVFRPAAITEQPRREQCLQTLLPVPCASSHHQCAHIFQWFLSLRDQECP